MISLCALISIVDFKNCGDFRPGSEMARFTKNYPYEENMFNRRAH